MDFIQILKYHLKNYLHFEVNLPRLPYFVLVFLHALLWTLLLYMLFGEAAFVEADAQGDLVRATMLERLLHLSYSALLIPFHIKRMKDAGIAPKYGEIMLCWMYVPTVLSTFLSFGAIKLLAPVLFLGSLPGMYYSIYLIFALNSKATR